MASDRLVPIAAEARQEIIRHDLFDHVLDDELRHESPPTLRIPEEVFVPRGLRYVLQHVLQRPRQIVVVIRADMRRVGHGPAAHIIVELAESGPNIDLRGRRYRGGTRYAQQRKGRRLRRLVDWLMGIGWRILTTAIAGTLLKRVHDGTSSVDLLLENSDELVFTLERAPQIHDCSVCLLSSPLSLGQLRHMASTVF